MAMTPPTRSVEDPSSGAVGGEPEVLDGEGEQDVDEAEAEEGDVGEPQHAPSPRAVAAEPVLDPEEETRNGPGQEADEDPDPSGEQVRSAVHDFPQVDTGF